ncbi:MAG TPA: peptidylprolyl isomerase [Candidatus Angelobacter sp.]|nr:peptidylprolyl isomerase [Candidatus Angelobacter sp.]
MLRFFMTVLLLATSAAAMQTSSTTQPTKPVSKTQPASASDSKGSTSSASSEPVITIHASCANLGTGKATDSCTRVVNKQEFDVVVNGLNAIGPALLPMQKRSVAEGYANTILNYEAAKKAGVEKDPRFAEVMRLARMRAMGDMYRAMMQEKASKVTAEEIQSYYKDNPGKFEELTVRRVTLPRYNVNNLKDEEFAEKARKVADEIHDRAAKGEDLEALQKDAFETLGLKNPPTTKMAPVRHGVFAPEQEKQLFALKPGEVSGVIEQSSAFIIFKLEGRETLTQEQAKDEITRAIIKQHQEKQESASAIKIDYNEQYLGQAPASGWMPASQLNASGSHAANPKSSADTPLQPK